MRTIVLVIMFGILFSNTSFAVSAQEKEEFCSSAGKAMKLMIEERLSGKSKEQTLETMKEYTSKTVQYLSLDSSYKFGRYMKIIYKNVWEFGRLDESDIKYFEKVTYESCYKNF